ncbi:hypothetical protein [Ascidiaceihabitans sp.]|uniref:hypothetical protein n=1 Tax=Ascidiaceihabitans sp. TaxID=1872644 RepID=UPI0032996AC8
MKSLALFLWLIVPAGVCLAIFLWGTPHVVLSYRFYDNGDAHNPLAARIYISCDYFGVSGWRTDAAHAGACPWIRFFRGGGQ